MAFDAQTFPTDLILPGLISWFNSQSAELRVIETNDVAFFRVRLVQDENGTISMVVGEQPYTAAGSKYLYEATFIWRGARGINLTATASSFFEISKFVATPETVAEPLNIIPFIGHVLIPADVDEVPWFKMTFGTNYRFNSDGNDMYTVGINGNGEPEVRTDNSYINVNSGLTNVREVTGGDCWAAARTADGEVWAWGQNFSLFSGPYNTAQQLDIGYYTGSSVAKQIGALQDALLVLDNDGNVVRMGSGDYLGELTFPSNVSKMHTFWDQVRRYEDGSEYEITFQQTAVFFIHTDGSFSVTAGECRQGSDMNYDVSIANNLPGVMDPVKQIIGTFDVAAVVTTAGDLVFWGDNNPQGATGYVSDIFVDVDEVFMTSIGQWVVKKTNGMVYYFNGLEWMPIEYTVDLVAGSNNAFVMKTTTNELVYLGDPVYDRDDTPGDLVVENVRQVHMGGRWTCVLMNNGDLIWWGGGQPM